jgi:TatA/E family protein of Tat protein translocase
MLGSERDSSRRCAILGVGTAEILLIVALVLILFGPGRMSEIVRSFGRASHEIRKAMLEVRTEIEDSTRTDDRPPGPHSKP